MRVIFAHTRYQYDSYRDYLRLVELSGFETCYVDQIRLDEKAFYIVTPINGEFRPHLLNERNRVANPSARVVWWNLERPDSGEGALSHLVGTMVCNVLDEILLYVDAVWTPDRFVHAMDAANRRHLFVPMGSHAGLAEGPRLPIEYDVCHFSYPNGRRALVMARLAGLKVAGNGWGAERAAVLQRSRLMLNVHQTDAPIGEPLRFALAAAHRLPLISEHLADPHPMVQGIHFRGVRHSEVAMEVLRAVQDERRIHGLGDALYELLCVEYPFRKNVYEGVAATLQSLCAQ